MNKKGSGLRHQESMDKILDDLFQDGPGENMISKAQASLHTSLTAAKENAILFGQMDHPTTNSLFVAMRGDKVIAIDFGVFESDFITKIGR